ncbi:hypothetical protein GCK72_012397 [Caenorhabditis remanei]|uniref:Uncharacterized protein n=1 Tax=Caenorhabditis remanei TaxID=31234 RepID=A0A6A5GMR4_CAERE|nr:hypothetical protein GCK72_012397 [Caenorhabditis remanei]KAF1755944.1 hypothetical protein GCK72_012397 [Caenorhabditis remanei]
MNCRFLEVGKAIQKRSIFRDELKILANYWVASDELMSWKAFFFHDIKDHDDGLACDEKRRSQHIRYTDPRTGRDYIRTDGAIATVVKWNEDMDITGALFYAHRLKQIGATYVDTK